MCNPCILYVDLELEEQKQLREHVRVGLQETNNIFLGLIFYGAENSCFEIML